MVSSYTKRALDTNKRGTDCSGADGTTNRTLIITEGPLLDNIQIFVGGRMLHPDQDYTFDGQTITFLVIIDDTDFIRVIMGR